MEARGIVESVGKDMTLKGKMSEKMQGLRTAPWGTPTIKRGIKGARDSEKLGGGMLREGNSEKEGRSVVADAAE